MAKKVLFVKNGGSSRSLLPNKTDNKIAIGEVEKNYKCHYYPPCSFCNVRGGITARVRIVGVITQ